MNGAIPDSERNVLECFDDPNFKIKNGHVVNLDLTCSFYLLTSLPESIGNLIALKNLNAGINQLTSLPESIGNLIALENLNLGINKLTTLPKGIGNLIALKNLNLSQNQLTFLPESIENLILLENLDLSKNQFTSLPESINNLEKIRNLDLRDNPIKTLSHFSRNNLIYSLLNPDFLTYKGRRLYERRRFIELLEYYHKTPGILASEYAFDPKSLTEDEMVRLIHEMGRNEEKILESRLSLKDPILRKIMERDSRELSSGLRLFF
jgi:hypothetical protein